MRPKPEATPKPTPKSEAIKAIHHAISVLGSGDTIDRLAIHLLVGSLAYASEQVAKIEELKRARRKVREADATAAE